MANNKVAAAIEAILDDDVVALSRLLKSGLDPNQVSDDKTLLTEAAGRSAKLTLALLEKGARVDEPNGLGDTPLVEAVKNQNLESVAVLLKHGANPNFGNLPATAFSELAWQSSPFSIEAAELFLKHGADVNLIGFSETGDVPTTTPLINAANASNSETVEFLLKHGAMVNEQVRFGTALTAAAAEGDVDSVQLLLDAGADVELSVANHPSMRDLAGKNALEVARIKKKKAVVELLEARSHKPSIRKPGADSSPIAIGWKRLQQRLSTNHPDVAQTLRPAAAKGKVKALETKLSYKFPSELVEWFSLQNGQEDKEEAMFIPGEEPGDRSDLFRLLGVNEIIGEWKIWTEAAEGRTSPRAKSSGYVASDFFNRGWIPLTSNGGGDNHCYDLNPGKRGTVGQIILVTHDDPARKLVASSLAEWLAALAEF